MTELTLVERLKAFAMAEARHGIGRQRKNLFNEAGDVINGLMERIHYAEGTADANIARAEAAEKRVAELEALRDNQQFMMEYIENHFPQAMDEAEHALAEWDGKP